MAGFFCEFVAFADAERLFPDAERLLSYAEMLLPDAERLLSHAERLLLLETQVVIRTLSLLTISQSNKTATKM